MTILHCRHEGCFVKRETLFKPEFSMLNHVPLKSALFRKNKVQSMDELCTSHYRLSSLILRHCQTNTGVDDDATRLLKDDAPGGGIVEALVD